MNKENNNPFLSRKISNLLLKFSVPAVAGMMVNAAYNIIARLLVGHEVGALGIAGITIMFPIGILYLAFSALVGVGGNALFSISLGKKNYKEAEQILGNVFILLIVICGFFTVISYFFLDEFLIILGAGKEILPYAKEYAQIVLVGYFFFAISLGMNNFIRSSGHPKIALMTQVVGTIVNLIVGPILIYYLHLGMKGAAISTLCGQTVGFVWIMLFFIGKKCKYRIRFQYFKLRLKVVLSSMSIGVAQFIFQISSSLLNLILNYSLLKYGGNTAVAAIGIVISINTLIVFSVIGIAQGTQPLIGYNYGAKKYAAAIQVTKMAMRWGFFSLIIGFSIVEFFAPQIVLLFNSSDQVLVEMSTRALRLFSITLPIISIQILASTYFQAINKPLQATVLSLSRQVILVIPFVLILPLFFGLDGVFVATAVADFISCIISAVLLHHFFHKHKQSLFLPAKIHKKISIFKSMN
ncbi:MAG: MATE family efflux transporter [Endomicrobiia bacterium]